MQFFRVLVLLLAPAIRAYTVLTSENFEHLTQMTTGSTTGKWVIVFGTKSPPVDALKALEQNESLEDIGLTTGSVDTLKERALHARFANLLREEDNDDEDDVALFFPNDGKAYVVELNFGDENTAETFFATGYRAALSFNVPPVPSFLDLVVQGIADLTSMPLVVALGGGELKLIAVFLGFVILLTMASGKIPKIEKNSRRGSRERASSWSEKLD